jgi:ribosomal protein S18 acetylase RimI-like enzyme
VVGYGVNLDAGDNRGSICSSGNVGTPCAQAERSADIVSCHNSKLTRPTGLGLARKLISAGIEWVRAQTEGLPDVKRQVFLGVHRHNESAKALYDGLGFVESKDGEEDPIRVFSYYTKDID